MKEKSLEQKQQKRLEMGKVTTKIDKRRKTMHQSTQGKDNHCTECGEEKKELFQQGQCRDCLADSFRNLIKVVDEFR